MARLVAIVSATILGVLFARPIPVEAEASLVSVWQHCEPGKGCSKFAFMPNGHVIEQYPLAGRLITAYGRYHIRGTVLKIGWKRVTPSQVCNIQDTNEQCLPTIQSDFKGPFHFDGQDALLWLTRDEPPLQLLRIKL